MEQLSDSDKQRLLDFIKENDLDYISVDNGITAFHLVTYDKKKLFIHPHEGGFLIRKYDPDKDKEGPQGANAHQYFQLENLQQVLEQLKVYDDSLHKVFWQPTTNSIEIGFDSVNYIDDWHNDFKGEDEFWSMGDAGNYNYLTYKNDNYKPELKSPYNTISEVSPINDEVFSRIDTLHFEIHPISCAPGQESYLLKLQCNNEKVLKEYINYLVSSKKGLRLLLETIFKEMEQFKS